VQKKGCKYLLEAMAKVQAARPSAELVIIGSGPLQSELETRAAATLRSCRFLGALGPDQVREWYGRATLFCAPSVTADSGETEGLPITIMEAQAMGLPIVSTYHSGIPEAVKDDETGLLVNEHDSDALADRILALLQDRARAERLGNAARASALQHFDMKTQISLLEDVYQQLSERPRDVPQLRR
jgi:glycosyltransferase involved in cell wall biosynthesis